MAKKLFVGNLSWGVRDQQLSDFFAQAGSVVSASVIMDRNTGRSKGFGFVEMATDEEATKAEQELNGKDLDGRPVSVSEARPREPRENNFGGGNFGGGRRDFRGGRNDRGPRY